MSGRAIYATRVINASLLIATLTVSGCASLQEQARAVYSPVDIVDQVDPEQLVGLWVATELNPIPGNDAQLTTIEYFADGVVVGNILLELGTPAQSAELAFEINGQWLVNENVVTHYNVQMQSLDGSETGLILSQVINEQAQNNREGIVSNEATVVEIMPDRMVMVGTDGIALEYIRQ